MSTNITVYWREAPDPENDGPVSRWTACEQVRTGPNTLEFTFTNQGGSRVIVNLQATQAIILKEVQQ